MVTDNTGFIGTSNWSADYFINTGGIGFVFKPEEEETGAGGVRGEAPDLRTQLADVFQRDWESSYAGGNSI